MGRAYHRNGDCQKPEYKIRAGMLDRCRNRKSDAWKYYGGRGIRVRFKSFREFFAEVGPRPSPQSVDNASAAFTPIAVFVNLPLT